METLDTDRPAAPFADDAPEAAWAHVATSDRDQLSRKLRISLVDHCNFHCFFCHNEGQGPLGARGAVLSIDQIARLCEAALDAGVREIKLTGGEPLLYRRAGAGIVDVVDSIATLRRRHVFGLSMTTNALLLAKHAHSLRDAGLDRVTISLHTLAEETLRAGIYRRGTGKTLDRVIEGIEAAHRVGFSPLKVNTVLFAEGETGPGNLEEIPAIADLCRVSGVDELRLYTLLSHKRFSGEQFRERYQFWDRATLSALMHQLTHDPDKAAAAATIVESFVDRWRETLYPKPVLQLELDRLSICIEAMADGRFAQMGLSAEGAYALRLSAAGVLRGALEGGRARPMLGLLRSNTPHHELQMAFAEARATFLPEVEGSSAPAKTRTHLIGDA